MELFCVRQMLLIGTRRDFSILLYDFKSSRSRYSVKTKLEFPVFLGADFSFKIDPTLEFGIVDFGVSTQDESSYYNDQVLSPNSSCSLTLGMPSPVLYEADSTFDEKQNSFLKPDHRNINAIDSNELPLDFQGLLEEEPDGGISDQILTSYLEELVGADSNQTIAPATATSLAQGNFTPVLQQFPIDVSTTLRTQQQAVPMPQARTVSEYSDTLDSDWVKIDEADLADLPCFSELDTLANLGTIGQTVAPTTTTTNGLTIKVESVSSTCATPSPSTSASSSGSRTLSGRSKAKRGLPKDSEEYKAKRARNNVAVRRSRDKAKQRQIETEQRVHELTTENDKLTKKVDLLTKELTVLKGLFLNVGASLPEDLQKYLQQ